MKHLPPPDVVVISIDTLRPDHLGAYGYARDTSPTIDRLASEGALFTNAISSSSWTLPAHAALFTGLADSVHGCHDSDKRLADEHITLAETFSERGYRTAGFFSGPFLHPTFGLDQGFDSYADCSSYASVSAEKVRSTGELDQPDITAASHRDVTNPRVLEAVTDYLGEAIDEPLFLFVHLWDVHFDFIPPPPFDTRFDPDYTGEIDGENFFHNPDIHAGMDERDLAHVKALYDGEIAWTDHHIGLLLEQLERRGRLDNTVVVITSDHGEEFFEHGRKGHRFTLYDEVIRIPLVLWAPGRIDPGQRIEAAASLVDVFATVAGLAGLETGVETMGRSLIPLLDGTAEPDPTALSLSELDTLGRKFTSFRKPKHKLLVDHVAKATWTFDMAKDPGERLANRVTGVGPAWERDLIRDAAGRRAKLIAMRKEHRDKRASATLAPTMIEQLEALGYLEGNAQDAEASDSRTDPRGLPTSSPGETMPPRGLE
ncbi:MAG: sulfatase [Myxococcota bacterium]|nr:sulfatase [Myxococcota bacterium]